MLSVTLFQYNGKFKSSPILNVLWLPSYPAVRMYYLCSHSNTFGALRLKEILYTKEDLLFLAVPLKYHVRDLILIVPVERVFKKRCGKCRLSQV